MVKYLYMDGVDDYLKTPSITFDKVILDVQVERLTDKTRWYLDGRTGFSFGYFVSNTNGTDGEGNASQMDTYIDGVGPKTNNTVMVPNNVRCLIETRWTVVGTDDFNVFASSSNTNGVKGNIYNVKFYNDTTLVAHYDMSTGTVQDQSGNGNHATLTGGTWMDDGTGGGTTPTVHEGESILSSTSNLTAESNLIYNGESTLSAVSDLIAEASVIQSAETILSAISNLTAIGSIFVNGETILSANSELTAIGEIVSMDISVDLSARASLTVEGSVIQTGEASFSALSQLEVLASLIVSGEIELSATSQLSVLPEKDLVGVIRLKGKRELFIYLKGKRELEVHLKGGLNVTVVNENFTMEAGDNKELVFDVGENFAGSQEISWELYNKRSDIDPFIKISGYAQNNEVRVPLIPNDTKTYLGRSIFYELIVVDPLQKKSTLTKGMVTFE